MIRRQKILIVDDRRENLLALEKTLADVDADVVKAGSGNQALAACLNHEFALAILDVQMPGMDGYELAGLLRGDERTRDLPIIFLTAERTDDLYMFKGYESGAVDYIIKPYSPPVFLSKVCVFLELDRRRTEILVYQKQLELANKELEAFSYSVSHDLRAPLRAIEGYSRALLEDCGERLDKQGKEYLELSSAAARRMAQLIDDLLRLSQVTRSEMRAEHVDLSSLAREVVENLRQAEPDRRVEVAIEEGLAAAGDARLLRQVLQNLLGNAWKFTSKQPNAKIEFGKMEKGSIGAMEQSRHSITPSLHYSSILFVRDNGAGFDMEYADKLFAPFQRLHSEGEFSGSGVGLATVQRIVHRHDGKIWAESEVDRGATFFFTLSPALKG
jgi:signal transduction histidine kinase